MSQVTTRDWINNFESGSYRSKTRTAQIEAGWFDWFCTDSSLANKTISMGNIIRKIKDGGKVDLDNTYVWFQNNCPGVGSLYNSFSFNTLSDDRIFLVTIDEHRSSNKYTVYYGPDNYREIFGCKTSTELVKWLNTAPADKAPKFKVGEFIIYRNGETYELGLVKSIRSGSLLGFTKYFVQYHTGETAACTCEIDMHKITNAYAFEIARKVCE